LDDRIRSNDCGVANHTPAVVLWDVFR